VHPSKARSNTQLRFSTVASLFLLAMTSCTTVRVTAYDSATSTVSPATLNVVSAEWWLPRMMQSAVIDSIDNRADPAWQHATQVLLTPGTHTICISYYQATPGAVKTQNVTITPMRGGPMFIDEACVTFAVTSGKTYRLTYDVEQFPEIKDLRLKVVDLATGATIAETH